MKKREARVRSRVGILAPRHAAQERTKQAWQLIEYVKYFEGDEGSEPYTSEQRRDDFDVMEEQEFEALGPMLWRASKEGDAPLVARLLVAGAPIEFIGRWKQTPLLVAALRGHREVVDVLIGRGANIEARDGLKRLRRAFGRTAIMYAAINQHLSVVKLLADSGADINARNCAGYNALVYATESDNFDGHAGG